jgi:hypothetical protein
MSERKSILLVVPVFQSVYPKPFANFCAMLMHAAHTEGAKYSFSVHVPEREILHSAMNRAAETILKHDFDAAIVCDDDCLPPVDAISRLLRYYEDGKPIVAGLGFMRGFPHTTTAGRYYPEGLSLTVDNGVPSLSGFEWLDDLKPSDGLVPADFCGFPIAMISRAAFQAIQPPWFGTEIDGGACTHDVYFGTKAKRAGLPILVDAGMPCGHLAATPIITLESRAMPRRAAQIIKARGLQVVPA